MIFAINVQAYETYAELYYSGCESQCDKQRLYVYFQTRTLSF